MSKIEKLTDFVRYELLFIFTPMPLLVLVVSLSVAYFIGSFILMESRAQSIVSHYVPESCADIADGVYLIVDLPGSEYFASMRAAKSWAVYLSFSENDTTAKAQLLFNNKAQGELLVFRCASL